MDNMFFPNRTSKRKVSRELNQSIKLKTFGQRSADMIATIVGSWKFIISQSIFLTCWIILNLIAYINVWDPYPFILLNLFLSFQAAYTGPIVMMSQNRQEERDRIKAEHNYKVNENTEDKVEEILDHLHAQNNALKTIIKNITEITSELKKIRKYKKTKL